MTATLVTLSSWASRGSGGRSRTSMAVGVWARAAPVTAASARPDAHRHARALIAAIRARRRPQGRSGGEGDAGPALAGRPQPFGQRRVDGPRPHAARERVVGGDDP